MALIDDIMRFLKTCPHLKEYKENPYVLLAVDSLGKNDTQYSIEAAPVNEWVKRYVDGSGIKQFVFAFTSVEPYSEENNLKTMAFYEAFSKWTHLAQAEYPDWIRLETLTGGYLMDIDEGAESARYQIQCRLIYSVPSYN